MREGLCYTLWWSECGEEVAAYEGETAQNSYTCGLEHWRTENEDKSVLWLNSVHHHQGRVGVEYHMRVTSSHSSHWKKLKFRNRNKRY